MSERPPEISYDEWRQNEIDDDNDDEFAKSVTEGLLREIPDIMGELK